MLFLPDVFDGGWRIGRTGLMIVSVFGSLIARMISSNSDDVTGLLAARKD
jgi:hypothetical protein